jgi:cysteine desulfurase
MNRVIFLDNHSTTPIDPRVLDVMNDVYLNHYGNPSSVDHALGDDARELIRGASRDVGSLLNVNYQNIIYTSGSTESINLGLIGRVDRLKAIKEKIRIIVSPIEHPAVLSCCEKLEKSGVEVHYLEVDEKGCLDLIEIESECKKGADILCVMAVNHEIGNINPIYEISKIANNYGVEYFCDATQGVGKIPIDFDGWGIDYLAFSGHKIYGPKGIGALVVKDKNKLHPILYGGGQQYGLRSGTLDVPGIVGLGKACSLRNEEKLEDEKSILNYKSLLLKILVSKLENFVLLGDVKNKVAGNLSFSVSGIDNQGVISRIRHVLAVSTGSACNSGAIAGSRVLRTLKLKDSLVNGFIRICIGKFNDLNELKSAAVYLIDAIKECDNSLKR